MSWFDASEYFVIERLVHERRPGGVIEELAALREDPRPEDSQDGGGEPARDGPLRPPPSSREAS